MPGPAVRRLVRRAGRTWSAPEPLAPAQPSTAYPDSNAGRLAGDYISTSFTVRRGVRVTGTIGVTTPEADASRTFSLRTR